MKLVDEGSVINGATPSSFSTNAVGFIIVADVVRSKSIYVDETGATVNQEEAEFIIPFQDDQGKDSNTGEKWYGLS